VNVIEDPVKREAFVKDLKALIEATKVAEGGNKKPAQGPGEKKEKQLELVRNVFGWFETLFGYVRESATKAIKLVAKTPEGINATSEFLAVPENRSSLFTLLINAGSALILATILLFFLRRPSVGTTAKMKNLPSKAGWGFIRLMLVVAPYACLVFTFILLCRVFPSLPEGRTILILFFTLLFLYQAAMEIIRTLFSPDEKVSRILPLEDENANYLWIWARRFCLYAFFYFMVTLSLLWTNTVSDFYLHIRAFCLLGFPLMLTAFILQVAREIRLKRKQEKGEEKLPLKTSNRLVSLAVRFWPLLGLGYVWAIFFTLMFQFDKGFLYLFHATLGTAISILAVFLFLRFLDWLFQAFFRVNERVQLRFPDLEGKINRYVLMIRKGLAIAIVILGAGVIAHIWGIPVAACVASETGAMIILRAVAIIVTLALLVFIVEMSQTLSV